MRRTLRGPVRTRVRQWQARAPVLAPGRRPGPPDFVGIGVQRCGTSWWHSVIEQHPAVESLGWGAKELHFFDDLWRRGATDDDAEAYARHCLRRTGRLVGEWTPRYLYDPWAIPALLQVAPSAKLLVMVRDPLARFRSGLRHALNAEGALRPETVTDAFARGLYGAQLSRLLDHAPREQILVLQMERCIAQPGLHAAETYAFLGLRPYDAKIVAPVNQARNAFDPAPDLVEAVRRDYVRDTRIAQSLFPDRIDTSLWNAVRD